MDSGTLGSGTSPKVCPNCGNPLNDKLICWTCCDRLCLDCGQMTGSAFINTCWPCSFARENAPAENEVHESAN